MSQGAFTRARAWLCLCVCVLRAPVCVRVGARACVRDDDCVRARETISGSDVMEASGGDVKMARRRILCARRAAAGGQCSR